MPVAEEEGGKDESGEEVKGKVPDALLKKILDTDPLVTDTNSGVKKRMGTVSPKRRDTKTGRSGGQAAGDTGLK